MVVKLTADFRIEFISGIAEINENDTFLPSITVIPEVPLTNTEELYVAFENGVGSTYANHLFYDADINGYTASIPDGILALGAGTWEFQILRRRYETQNRGRYVEKASVVATFTVAEGVKTVSGTAVTGADLQTIYTVSVQAKNDAEQAAEKAKEYAESIAPTDNANLENGTGTGGVQQIPDGTRDGFDFTGKNEHATALDAGLTGIIPYGAIGNFSSAFGGKSSAQGKRALAEGTTTIAKGDYSHAEGNSTVTLAQNAHAEGLQTTANGLASHAEGQLSVAKGKFTHAEGYATTADNDASHAEGRETKALGAYSHAEGTNTVANATATHAEGQETTASASASHAEGHSTTASGVYSHAEGLGSTASAEGAHAEGKTTTASAPYAHAEGRETNAKGNFSHTEGYQAKTEGQAAHAEGWMTKALKTGAHAEGRETEVSGDYAHAEGYTSNATGKYAHAEGRGTTASGDSAHTEGEKTTASGAYSHASGYNSNASGAGAFAHGRAVTAGGDYQSVFGKYNKNSTDTILEVGNGAENAPSNAFEVLKDGRARAHGKPKEPTDIVRLVDVDELVASMGGGKLYIHSFGYEDEDEGEEYFFKFISTHSEKYDTGVTYFTVRALNNNALRAFVTVSVETSYTLQSYSFCREYDDGEETTVFYADFYDGYTWKRYRLVDVKYSMTYTVSELK